MSARSNVTVVAQIGTLPDDGRKAEIVRGAGRGRAGRAIQVLEVASHEGRQVARREVERGYDESVFRLYERRGQRLGRPQS